MKKRCASIRLDRCRVPILSGDVWTLVAPAAEMVAVNGGMDARRVARNPNSLHSIRRTRIPESGGVDGWDAAGH